MIRLNTIHRRLTSTRRGRKFAVASVALAFATGYSGRSHAGKPTPSRTKNTPTATHSAPPPQHVLPANPAGGKSLRLQGVRVQSQIENGRLVVSGFSGSVGGGRVSAAGRVDTADKAADQNIRAQFDNVDLREVLHVLGVDVGSAGLSGVRADGLVNLQWRGMDPSSVRHSVTGNAVVKSGAGTIAADSPLLKRLADAAGIEDLGSLRFSSIRIEAQASNGVVQVRSLVIQGDQFRLAAAGTVGLRNEQIDLAMDVDVVEALAKRSSYYKLQSLASMFSRNKADAPSNGFVEVPRILLAGNLRQPEVRMDRQARATAAAARAQTGTVASQPARPVKVAPVPEAQQASRQVARQDEIAEKKHVPLWRKVVTDLTTPDDKPSSTRQ